MIHKPWSRGTGSYTELDNKADIPVFMKRKRRMQMVIFTGDGDLLPVKCRRCGKMITADDGNRVDITSDLGQIRSKPYHYDCSWENVMAAVYKLGDELRY